MLQVRRHAWRALPLLLLLALYWPGLTTYFYQDDFGWLNLHRDVYSWRDVPSAIFAPKAHGNIRPLGENAYFLLLSSWFGVHPLPFRICAFLTQMANLLLLGSIVERPTASRAAAFTAQILWIASPGLAAAMSWTSIYNQILSAFFFLLAFHSMQRGRSMLHWIAFILGLGALETNVVYPALAAAYALLYARPRLKPILPMFAVSALAVFAHFKLAPLSAAGAYALHFDTGMLATLGHYWMLALGPSRLAAAILTCAAVTLLVLQFRARQWTGLLGLAWFIIVIAPYLPLRDHQMDYYLAVPVIGLTIIGASAAVSQWPWKAGSIACAALYLATCTPAAWTITSWHHDRAARIEDLVQGVAEIHAAQPGKIILLSGIDNDLFWSGLADVPFRVMKIPHVYLAPGSESHIAGDPAFITRYAFPSALALAALEDGRAVVYEFNGSVLRNATARYRAQAPALWKNEPPRFINLGDPLYEPYLGPGWDAATDGFRTLRGAATLRIAGPRSANDRLVLTVFNTPEPQLSVRVDGQNLPAQLLSRSTGTWELTVPLPEPLTSKPEIQIELTNTGRDPLRFGFAQLIPS